MWKFISGRNFLPTSGTIQNSADNQRSEARKRVAEPNCVVAVSENQTADYDCRKLKRFLKCFRRRVHQFQNFFVKARTDESQNYCNREQKRHHVADKSSEIATFSGSKKLRDYDLSRVCKAHCKKHQEARHVTCRLTPPTIRLCPTHARRLPCPRRCREFATDSTRTAAS